MSATPPEPAATIPTLADLERMRRWTAWQEECPPGRAKPTKVPYRNPGTFSNAGDPGTWLTLGEARDVAALLPRPTGKGGVGIFLGDLGNGWHLVGIDYDRCIDGNGLADWAQAGLDAGGGTYGEFSPGGEGIKQFWLVAASDMEGVRAALGIGGDTRDGRRWSRAAAGAEGHPAGIEAYTGRRYFTVTGDSGDLPSRLERLTPAGTKALLEAALPLLGPTITPGPALRVVGPGAMAGAGTGAEDDTIGADAAERLEEATRQSGTLARLRTGDTSDLHGDGSRSAAAFRLAAALRDFGFSRGEARIVTAAASGAAGTWMAEKGDPAGDGTGREWLRAWEAAGAGGIGMGALPQVEGLSSHDPRPSEPLTDRGGRRGGDRGESGDEREPEGIGAVITGFNARYMVVNESGKALVYAPAMDPILKRRYFERLDFADLRKLFLNRRIEVGQKADGSRIWKPVADAWLEHRDRRQYLGGVVFDPAGRPEEGVLNLWQGFGVQPAGPGEAGSWDLLRRHMLEVLCAGDEGTHRYLLDWLARMLQRPAEQGGTAIVMRGGEGCGKGTLARAVKRLLGQHGMAVSNAAHLVGNFNAHLRDCVFLFADEAFYAGDPRHVGTLKSLITEPYLTVEAKYANTVQAPNFLHLMMASNEEWVVPASLTARRFLVLEVPDARVGDWGWFRAIWNELEDGGSESGYRAMLRDLLARDISGFDARRVPDTEGLRRQKTLSLAGPEAWWLDTLHRGSAAPQLGLVRWQETVPSNVLYDAYRMAARDRGDRHPLGRPEFGRFMVRMKCHMTRLTSQDGQRPQAYRLGSLEGARKAFDEITGLGIAWPDLD